MCYPGSTMPVSARKIARPGRTDKISVSIDRSDLSALRRRARRLYGGNISAVVGEGLRRIREEEGREALVVWLGSAGQASPQQRDALRSEWQNNIAPVRSGGRRKR